MSSHLIDALGFEMTSPPDTSDTIALTMTSPMYFEPCQSEKDCKLFTVVVYVFIQGTMFALGFIGNTLSFIVLQTDRKSHAATFLLQVRTARGAAAATEGNWRRSKYCEMLHTSGHFNCEPECADRVNNIYTIAWAYRWLKTCMVKISIIHCVVTLNRAIGKQRIYIILIVMCTFIRHTRAERQRQTSTIKCQDTFDKWCS